MLAKRMMRSLLVPVVTAGLLGSGLLDQAQAAKKKQSDSPVDAVKEELGGKRAANNWFVVSMYVNDHSSGTGRFSGNFIKVHGAQPAAEKIVEFMNTPFDKHRMVRRLEWESFPSTDKGAAAAENYYQTVVGRWNHHLEKGRREGLYQ